MKFGFNSTFETSGTCSGTLALLATGTSFDNVGTVRLEENRNEIERKSKVKRSFEQENVAS